MRVIALLCLLASVLSSTLCADAVNDKVRSLVDPQSYVVHQKLIDIIFKDRAEFFVDADHADSVKIATALKDNGLLDIFYKNAPRNLSATFRTVRSPLFMLKAVSDCLSELGYNFTLTSNMRMDQFLFEWTLSYKSDHAIDPALLSKRLMAYGIAIDDISKKGDEWVFSISASEPHLSEATVLNHTQEEPLFLQNPLGEYWIRLPETAKSVVARKKTGSSWVVYTAFYDKDLNILRTRTTKNSVRLFNATVPNSAVYMKITDNDVASNLRHGINLWIESR
ncbi:hypothetical protein FACS1894103_0580 [Campylobacterota bacterium]|nr:hypothetical protein FACS1894103_0530 [Campylobacterota bacterium]GHV58688.1 hypothetical protein FACS1894103_0580 [Campylobacterota bacterium]